MISDLHESEFEKQDWEAIQRGIAYGVDISLLIENLKLTPTARIEKLVRWIAFAEQVRHGGELKRSQDAT